MLTLHAAPLGQLIRSIAAHMHASVVVECDEVILQLPDVHGTGTLRGINFQNGLGLLLFDCTFHDDFAFRYRQDADHPLRCMFCLEGEMMHLHDPRHRVQYTLLPLLGSVTCSVAASEQEFRIAAATPIKIAVLEINRKAYYEKIACDLDTLPESLRDVFEDIESESSFLYQGYYSLQVAETVRQMFEAPYEGVARKAFVESRCLELFSHQVQQYNDDQLGSRRQVVLRQHDVSKLRLAREALLEDLRNPPTIPQLALRVGINEQKLKSGFKSLFQTTINQYLRDHRLERARLLLAEGTRNVEETMHEIGYVNRGYFARRFKEKYGVLPTDFLKTLRTEVGELNENSN
ncbi:MAG: AraC family transcriptional regulator [Catalinimonas sp.]